MTTTRPVDEPGIIEHKLVAKSTGARPEPLPPRVQVSAVKERHMVVAQPSHEPTTRRSLPTVERGFFRGGVVGVLRDLSLGADLAGRWRNEGLWSLEVGGSLGWRSFFVGAGYQAPASWDFEGRPVEVSAIPLTAGWRPVLWRGAGSRLRAVGMVILERLDFRRTDVAGTTSRGHWDLGISAGLSLARVVAGRFESGIRAGLVWFPYGREVEIPNGPVTRFSQLAVQLGFFVAYGGA